MNLNTTVRSCMRIIRNAFRNKFYIRDYRVQWKLKREEGNFDDNKLIDTLKLIMVLKNLNRGQRFKGIKFYKRKIS